MVELGVIQNTLNQSQAQTEIDLVNDEGQVKETLNLNEIDPIFATTFEQMIQESFAEGKHFFVAKIQSRQDQSNELDV